MSIDNKPSTEFESVAVSTSAEFLSTDPDIAEDSNSLSREERIVLIERRGNFLVEQMDPEAQLQKLAGLSEYNLELFLQTFTQNLIVQERAGLGINNLTALQASRDVLAAGMESNQLRIIDNYITSFEQQSNEIQEFEDSLQLMLLGQDRIN